MVWVGFLCKICLVDDCVVLVVLLVIVCLLVLDLSCVVLFGLLCFLGNGYLVFCLNLLGLDGWFVSGLGFYLFLNVDLFFIVWICFV